MTTSILSASAPHARMRVQGVAEALPPGERVLWEGTPAPQAIARHLLLVRPLSAYFAAMITWWMLANRSQVGSMDFWTPVGMQILLVGAVLGGFLWLARWIARSTTYAITDRRLVMRLGVIFPLTVNIPLSYIQGAQVKRFGDGTGQIALQLDPKERLAWIVLFPHVRPFSFTNPQPLLRGLTDPSTVGEVLRAATLPS
ncbi:MAG: hypothetical protein RL625_440 [Gemmatimonadota bacterium]